VQAFPQHAGGLWIELGRDGDPNQARALRQAPCPLAVEQPDGEREREFAAQRERVPAFGEYQEKTTRVIPVVALQRTR